MYKSSIVIQEKDKNDFFEKFIKAFELSDARVTFGLQAYHIDHIEAELQRWNEMPATTDGDKVNPKYIKYVWEKLGKELGWCPFTLALYYFEHIEEINNQ